MLSPDVDEASLNDWIDGEPRMKSAADCLVELGFFESVEQRYRYSETLESLRQLGDLSEGIPVRSASDRNVLEVVDGGESHTVEFKSTIRVDSETGVKKDHIEDAVLKTVAAFLNADGGMLLVGVKDDGTLLGIDADLRVFKDDYDRLERWIMGDFFGSRIGQEVIQSRVKCDFPRVRGLAVIRIEVQAHHEVVLVDEQKLFVRVGNQTRQLSGREMLQFAKQRGVAG